MRFRVQQVDRGERRRSWFVLCTQALGEEWSCRVVNHLQFDRELRTFGFEDYRDSHINFQRARAAIREFGLGQGYIECDSRDRDYERRQGDLRGMVPDEPPADRRQERGEGDQEEDRVGRWSRWGPARDHSEDNGGRK